MEFSLFLNTGNLKAMIFCLLLLLNEWSSVVLVTLFVFVFEEDEKINEEIQNQVAFLLLQTQK